ncbi:hypothetical protein AX769_14555 [Frondihabitans sp. PAMC 28766]|uniref:hypothetical protein n=1 Tax=Frondihabitans sp. PAMC 28766 TaxID=1795630 RepID=UPI00078C0E29|nr:hypothetical protein [Frondihabitans sp. PAMC 28766]AMM21135.1 hypothetical protein AX769_14555 [Frondihabitans sp. PAMC 28766]
MADFFSRFRRQQAGPDSGPAGEPSALDRWLARGDDETQAWATARPGPTADEIASRISSVPKSFVEEGVDLVALGGDVLDQIFLGETAGPPAHGLPSDVVDVLTAISTGSSDAARSAAAITLWVYASDDEFGPTTPPITQFWAPRVIAALAWRLSSAVDPSEWVSDAERRDEAARTLLLWSGFLPGGEDIDTARSLFAMRDSLQRNQAMAAALAQQQHRLDVTRQLTEARAREAAARYSSE